LLTVPATPGHAQDTKLLERGTYLMHVITSPRLMAPYRKGSLTLGPPGESCPSPSKFSVPRLPLSPSLGVNCPV